MDRNWGSKFHRLYGILMSLPRKNLSQNFSAQIHGVVLAFCVLSVSIFRGTDSFSYQSRLPADGTPCLLLALGILIDGGESVGILLFLEFGFFATAWFDGKNLCDMVCCSARIFHVSRHGWK